MSSATRMGRPFRERTDGPMFLTADGRRLDRYGAGRIVRKTARRAGIGKAVTPHTLRHAFITAALDAGVPLRDVQEAASHADPRTTIRYDRARGSLDRHASYRRRLCRRRRQVMAHPLAQLRPAVAAAERSCPNNTAVTHGDPRTNANRRSARPREFDVATLIAFRVGCIAPTGNLDGCLPTVDFG